MCITPVLGAVTAPGYLRRRLKFLHAQTRSPQAELPARACGSLFPRLIVSLALHFYPKRIQRRKKKKDIRKTFMQDRAQFTEGEEILAFIKSQVASMYIMWEFQADPIILRYLLPDRAVYN